MIYKIAYQTESDMIQVIENNKDKYMISQEINIGGNKYLIFDDEKPIAAQNKELITRQENSEMAIMSLMDIQIKNGGGSL